MDAVLDTDTAVPLLLAALSFQVVIALAGFALSRWKPAVARSALITQVLVAAFFLLIVMTPAIHADALAPDSPRLLSLAVFVGLLGLLKLLARFEEH